MTIRWPSRKFSVASVLALAFGGMMTLALGIVIIGSFSAAGRNTQMLIADRTNLVLDHVTREVDHFLSPAELALTSLAELLNAGATDRGEIDAIALGILKSTPQLGGMAIVRPDGRLRFLGRGPDASDTQTAVDTLTSQFKIAERSGVVWSDPFWSDSAKSTIINAQLRLTDDDEGARLLVTGVFLDRFVMLLNQLANDIGQKVFVLHNRDFVIGYTGFDVNNYDLNAGSPLPSLVDIDEPVLRRIWGEDSEPTERIGSPRLRGDARLVLAPGKAYGMIYREVSDFAQLPWLIGMQVDFEEQGDEFDRLLRSGVIALSVSAIAIFITLRLGKRLSLPFVRLADRATALQDMRLEGLPTLPSSLIKEVDQANGAFNAMSGAMHWFETYLPKRLVQHLMADGSPEDILSQERVVTVMFTDIVAFSSRTAMLTPVETAAFLNDHFDSLQGAVAAEDGLIDKYIGDGMMAFWGAPQEQPDHAARAIAAAYRIREKLAELDIALRIGLHTGPVLVGNIGASERLNYTIVGDTVNIAQRIEQFGKELPDVQKVTILASTVTIAHARAQGTIIGAPVLRGQNLPLELVRL